MAKMTVRELDAARPKNKPYKLTVDRRLYLRVSASGEKRWFVSYTVNGKRREYRLPCLYGNGAGQMPLAAALAENAKIQALARDGVDFQEQRETERLEAERVRQARQAAMAEEELQRRTVGDLFEVWASDGVNRADGNKELRRLFGKDVLPIIGNIPLKKLTDQDILKMLRKQMKRGVVRQALVTLADIRQMLTWGEKRQPWRGLLINGNPADLVSEKQIAPADYEESRDRTLSPAEIRELQAIFRGMDKSYHQATDKRATSRPANIKTQIALWICLGTLCRIGELMMARWEHVNLDEGAWFIPRENVKGSHGKKQEHYIFLSDFTKQQFEALKAITGKSA